MPRIVDLNIVRYDWVPGAAGLTTPSSPKVTELNSTGKAISAYVVTTTSLNPTSSDTVTEKGITDTSNAVVPTINNFEGHLDLFRDYTTGVVTANDPLTTIGAASGIVGWIVRRIGLPAANAWAVAQKVDVFYVMTDTPQQTGGQADGYAKAIIPLLQQGQMYLGVPLQA